MKTLLIKTLVSSLVFLILIAPISAIAQNTPVIPTGSSLEVEGLGIDPFLIEVNIVPGSSVTRSINLTNTTNQPLSFIASINDFVPNGNTGQALFLDSDKESDPKFSLSKWITVTKQPNFTIPPNGTTVVEFTITPPVDAEPGTHYGGILFGRPPVAVQNSETAVQQKAGSIILVKLGKSEEHVEISEFSTSKNIYQQAPYTFTTMLSNDGSVHAKPKGDITIRNIFGQQVAQVAVNRDALIVLPKSDRKFESQWNPKFAFGYYTADELLFYGNSKLELQAHTSFWVLPVKFILIGLMALTILIALFVVGVKRYNRYIIQKTR